MAVGLHGEVGGLDLGGESISPELREPQVTVTHGRK